MKKHIGSFLLMLILLITMAGCGSMEKEMTALVLGGRESHLMGMKEGSLAMLITSITKNDKGQVIDVTESIYPLERNKFVWKLKL